MFVLGVFERIKAMIYSFKFAAFLIAFAQISCVSSFVREGHLDLDGYVSNSCSLREKLL